MSINEDHTHRIRRNNRWLVPWNNAGVFTFYTDHTYRDVNYGMFPKYPQNMFSRCGDNSP